MSNFIKYKPALVIVNLLFIVSAFAQKQDKIQYISPINESELNARNTQIILRQGDDLDQSSIIPEIFTVIGDDSGLHKGETILSTDGKTLIFKPDKMFEPGEQVQVYINEGLKLKNGKAVSAFEFSFKITPLKKPLKIADYHKELNLSRFTEEFQDQYLQKMSVSEESLPTDFPTYTLVVNDSTSAGDYFLSPTRIVSGDGYNVIVSNTGALKYYEKINEGVPFNFSVASNGMLTYGTMSEYYDFGGGGDTEFKMMDDTYNVVDQFSMGNGYTSDFHEFQYMPNGHVFMVAYDLQPVDMSKLVDGGHPGALVAGSVIQELDTYGDVIFQWRSWDHYDLLDSYADLTKSVFDAIHINSIELDLSDLNIIVSSLALAEATKIDRNTGEIIWRMGGKNNQFTFQNESEDHAPLYFMFQHDIRRLKNGNITIFDGGDSERRKYSRAVEYKIDEENKTATKVWEYRKDPDIYSPNMGSVQRLANGNTVIGWGLASMYGDPMITEVDSVGNVVAELTFDKPLTTSYRAMKFDWDGGDPAAYVINYEVVTGNTYEFNEDAETGITMKITNHDGFGYNEIHVWRFNYGPLSPAFSGKAPVLEQAAVVVDQFAINTESFQASMLFDVDVFNISNPEAVVIYHRGFGESLFKAIPTQFNKATNKIVASMTEFGQFVIGYPDNPNQVFAPMLVWPKNGQMVDQSKKVTLEWTPVGYTNSFDLEVATDASFSNKIIDEQSLSSAKYVIKTVEANTEYFWRVSATNTVGESVWSQTSFNSTEPFLSLLKPNSGSKWTIGLEYFITWEDNLTEDVVLELLIGDDQAILIDTVASTGGYKWDIPLHLEVGDNYAIKISSVDNPDINSISNTFSLIDYQIAVLEEEHIASFLNFANPSSENIKITYQIRQPGYVNIKIYNTLGEVVSTLIDEKQLANTYSFDFSESGLPKGVYICTLRLNNSLKASKKILIDK